MKIDSFLTNDISREVYEKISERFHKLLTKSARNDLFIQNLVNDTAKLMEASALLEKAIHQVKIDQCFEGCEVKGDYNPFRPIATVTNLQQDKSKIRIGDKCDIFGHLLVGETSGEIELGYRAYIGEYNNIWSKNKITIGEEMGTSHHVTIVDSDFFDLDVYKKRGNIQTLPNEIKTSSAPVVIGNKAWINHNIIIFQGVTIGEGAIIASGAVVKKDIPDFCLAVGNPARVAKRLR